MVVVFPPRWSRFAIFLGLALGSLTCPVVVARPAGPPGKGSPRVSQHERLDDPPGRYKARDNLLARSQGLHVVFGYYDSIQVNVDGLGNNIVGDAANEPSLAVNPLNPLNMVVGWRQFDTIASNFREAGWAYTFDGGQTWTFPGVLEEGVFRTDPVLDVDSNGVFYYQSLKSDFSVDVFRSMSGGQLWRRPVYGYGGDKNWMVVDRSGGVGDGHVYGIWQRFVSCCDLDVLTRSTNGGVSFEPPVPVILWPTFGTMAVGPAGELYATGIDGTVNQNLYQFVVSKSVDARDAATSPTFTGVQVDMGGRMVFSTEPNLAGISGQSNVAVDRSGGPTNGNVYVLASVAPPAGTNEPLLVHLIRSTDGGATWSAPVRVNDDPAGSGNYHWFGALSVAPNGRIDAIWNDTRNSGVVSVSQLFYAYSWDAGVTWSPNMAVSPMFDTTLGYPNQNKMGDYYSIVSNETGADAVYAATFNGEEDVYYVNLFPDCNTNGISDVTDIAMGTSPDTDGSHVPDECETFICGGAGRVPGAPPMTVTALPNGDLSLEWSPSCRSADTDYAIYEGTLGNFISHTPKFCSTGGLTTQTFTPAGGGTYYLVVPTHAGHEGSYGKSSLGLERPQGPGACLPRRLCPCGF